MNPFSDPINIVLLLAVLAVFWRLKTMLGQRTGFEKPPIDFSPLSKQAQTEAAARPVETTRLPGDEKRPVWEGFVAADSLAAQGLEDIAAATPDFAVKPFLEGAKLAYEMVQNAFAKGDKKSLQPLLSPEVMAGFAQVIDDRQRQGHTQSMQFVGVKHADIVSAGVVNNRAEITLRLVGEMVSAVTDRAGNVIEGNPQALREVFDTWTFERDIHSRNPNWRIIDTTDDAGTLV
jgi:predicted lipid-binding transport protein (Tim44 family)